MITIEKYPLVLHRVYAAEHLFLSFKNHKNGIAFLSELCYIKRIIYLDVILRRIFEQA